MQNNSQRVTPAHHPRPEGARPDRAFDLGDGLDVDLETPGMARHGHLVNARLAYQLRVLMHAMTPADQVFGVIETQGAFAQPTRHFSLEVTIGWA